MNRRTRWMVGVVPAAALAALCGCDLSFLTMLLNPAGDNRAACQNVSPGDEFAAQIAYRGKLTKLQWSNTECRLDESTAVTTLTLVARNALDGYIMGDTDARFEITLRRENGLDIELYEDRLFEPNRELRTFDVRLSSTPTVNAVATLLGTGKAQVIDILRQGERVRVRINFQVDVLNLVTVTTENICGECNFDGPVQIID